MQISLRSQMAAGVAFAGAAAIAVTPIAQPSVLPALQTKASVALASLANPFAALVATGGLVINDVINGNYDLGVGGGAANWPGANIIDLVNAGLYVSSPDTPGIKAVGILPNIIKAPFPVATQVANNWIGYANTAFQAGGAALGSLSDVLWAPVGLTIAIAQDILAGNFADIPVQISDAITQAISGVTDAVQDLVGGAVTIVNNVVAKVSALATTLADLVPQLLDTVTKGAGALVSVATGVVTNITTALADADFEGAWNAGVAGLVGPGTNAAPSLPGVVTNLTIGAGQGYLTDPTDPTTYTFAPSIRTVGQTTANAVSAALAAVAAPAPAAAGPAASAKAAAAVAEAPAVADVADVADAPAAVEAPAADAAPAATAGDNNKGGAKATAKRSSHRAGKKG